MAKNFGSGDRLARGAVRAQFMPSEKQVSDKTWNDAFSDFDPEAFKKGTAPKVEAVKKERKRA